jgi:hypothetical protein
LAATAFRIQHQHSALSDQQKAGATSCRFSNVVPVAFDRNGGCKPLLSSYATNSERYVIWLTEITQNLETR